jgi:hypothetical protein
MLAPKPLSIEDLAKSPAEYEKFICENVLKNAQSVDEKVLNENHALLFENLRKLKESESYESIDESESEIDLTTTSIRTACDSKSLNANHSNSINNNIKNNNNNNYEDVKK